MYSLRYGTVPIVRATGAWTIRWMKPGSSLARGIRRRRQALRARSRP